MKVFYNIQGVPSRYKHSVIAIGVFDGLHLGHQLLIRKAVSRAKVLGRRSVVMTFDPHPAHILAPRHPLPLLISLEHRLELISSLGVDAVIVLKFNQTFAELKPEAFVKSFLIKPFSPCEIVVGDDFRFGLDRQGTTEILKAMGRNYGFHVWSVKTTKNGTKIFSSTAARRAILAGDLKQAWRILGRPVSIFAKVIKGDRRGRLLGFPTANLVSLGGLLPGRGVYIARVCDRGQLIPGMANIGVRPTFGNKNKESVEVHLFNFQKNLYHRNILVEFLHKIREEYRFSSSDALISQLKKDEVFSRAWFRKH